MIVAFIGKVLTGKIERENFDKLLAVRQDSSDFSIVKILRYTVICTLHSQIVLLRRPDSTVRVSLNDLHPAQPESTVRPDSTVRVSPNDFHPAQPEPDSLDTEVASSSTQPVINAEPCSQPAVRISSDNFHPAQPLSDSSLDVISIVSRCSQLE